jgi:hypothetical protein
VLIEYVDVARHAACGASVTVAKIQVSVGAVSFSGEGNEDWLEKQFDKLLASAASLASVAPTGSERNGVPGSANGGGSRTELGTLPSYLQKKNATTNQVKRFLVTASWLHHKGQTRLATKDVSAALSQANQKRLGNPADCLNQNVAKGHCEKEGGQFFVTPEGMDAIG